jgi:hypothetical protein
MIECNVKGANYSYLFAVASGIIFLGTPHRGSSWANRAYLAELWSPNLFRSSSAFIDLLRTRKTSALMSIADRFNNVWGSRPILSLRETKGRNWVGIVSLSWSLRRKRAKAGFTRLSDLIAPQQIAQAK